MAAKLLWSGVGLIVTFVVIWQAGQAGWVRPPVGPAPAGSRVAVASPDPQRLQPDSVIAEGRLVTYPGGEVAVATSLPG